MNIDVVLHPAEISTSLLERDLSGVTCVVFDVLRATSSMITGLSHGAREIHPVRTIEEARELGLRKPEALLGGERFGEKIEGFDLGNSPLEYGEKVRGQVLISTTTNGTVALRACEGAGRVLVGALLNLRALVAVLQRDAPEELLVVCAGTFANFALEDGYAAGRLIEGLGGARLSDAARLVWGLTRVYPEAGLALRASDNGRVLLGKGREAEVEWCSQVSCCEVVGEMSSGVIRACA